MERVSKQPGETVAAAKQHHYLPIDFPAGLLDEVLPTINLYTSIIIKEHLV
jgi:hypothetical protein